MIAACQRGRRILGVGSYAPERVMSNDEIATLVETSDEWISQRTGIHERRIAADGEGTARSARGRRGPRWTTPASSQRRST